MRRILPAALRALSAGLVLLLLLSACGLKGDLVLPDSASAPAEHAASPARDEESDETTDDDRDRR